MALIDTTKIGQKGGQARARNLSADELSEIGRKGAEARWGKKKGKAPPEAAAEKRSKKN